MAMESSATDISSDYVRLLLIQQDTKLYSSDKASKGVLYVPGPTNLSIQGS